MKIFAVLQLNSLTKSIHGLLLIQSNSKQVQVTPFKVFAGKETRKMAAFEFGSNNGERGGCITIHSAFQFRDSEGSAFHPMLSVAIEHRSRRDFNRCIAVAADSSELISSFL